MCFEWTLSSYGSPSVVTVSWGLLALHLCSFCFTALMVQEKMPGVQPSTPACWLPRPLALGRKVTSQKIHLSVSRLLVPAAVAQPPGGPSLCPCSPFSWGQPAVAIFFHSSRASLTSLPSLALPMAHLNPCWWFPVSDSHPALVAPLDRRVFFSMASSFPSILSAWRIIPWLPFSHHREKGTQ